VRGPQFSTFAVFIVGYMNPSSAAHALYTFGFTDPLNPGRAANSMWYVTDTVFVARADYPIASGKGLFTTTITRGKRKLWRHHCEGTHATHNGYENGALLSLNTDVSVNPGTALSIPGAIHVGCGGAGQPTLTGYLRKLVAFSPIPSAADIATIEALLTLTSPLEA
jgi:hypothetical protein